MATLIFINRYLKHTFIPKTTKICPVVFAGYRGYLVGRLHRLTITFILPGSLLKIFVLQVTAVRSALARKEGARFPSLYLFF